MARNKANPPEQLRLPSIKDVGLIRFLSDLKFIVFQLWVRTGAGADWVDDSRTIGYEFDDLFTESAKNQLKDDFISTAIDYTTISDQTILCTDAVTITLNAEPNDRELVKVMIANGDVTVSGNGKLLNKLSDVTVIYKNLSTLGALDIIYILELNEWFII